METSTDARERIEDLAERIVALRDAYYRGEPRVADADYDAIEDELRALIAAHPGPRARPEPARRGRRAGGAARAGAPQPADAVAGEGDARPSRSRRSSTASPASRWSSCPSSTGSRSRSSTRAAACAGRSRAATGRPGDDVTMLVRALADGVPDALDGDAGGRVEVRGEAVMLRSTFAAYNDAHPDKPLINPRNAAAGTLRAKDPEVVAGRRLRFFAFDLDARTTSHADLGAALLALGFEAPDMRHCENAEAAQEVIAAIEAEPGRARLRPRRRRAAARRPQRLRRGRDALQQPARRARLQVRRPRRRRRCSPTWCGTSARSARSPRSPCSSPCSSAARRSRARRSPTRRSSARATSASATPCWCAAPGDVIPFVAGVLDASQRTGDEREIVPPDALPVLRAAAVRAGQQPRAVLHQRGLPGPDGAAADPLGLARRGRHRGDRPEVDRAPQRGRAARAPVGLLRARARRRCWPSTASPTCRPTGCSSRSTAAAPSACAGR